ncbi:ergosterol biosynthesis ERG4/ERG24 family-domain-containing protein [Gaertneriomyces semiglobifer]|nr:ergosterol biosynthesis ERG4/ERG24 family-domain-containing protein [Gaertneriomyces semiglobifer]
MAAGARKRHAKKTSEDLTQVLPDRAAVEDDKDEQPIAARTLRGSHSREGSPSKSVSGERTQVEEVETRTLNAKLPYIPETTTSFEFLGPHLTVVVLIGTFLTAIGLQLLCSPTAGCPPKAFYADPVQFILHRIDDTTFFSPGAFAAVIGWMLFQSLLYGLLPGTYMQGVELPTGERLEYKINAFPCMVVTYLTVVVTVFQYGLSPLLWIADNMVQLGVAAGIYSTAQAIFLYIRSFRSSSDDDPVILSINGNSGYPHYDFYMGRELNPRLWGWFDLKYFCELRPGLVGWSLINVAAACKQYVRYGSVSPSMCLILLFEGYYVLDAQYFEPAILTTMDITTDGFGFMLSFGDLGWVPFTYTLQALHEAYKPTAHSPLSLLGIMALNATGLLLFRTINNQKNMFRTTPDHPSVRNLKYIQTKRGTKLLCDGWWGRARHVNYTADWIMALSWCMCAGFDSPIPYFYAFYFAILLIHRETRDEHKCREKYGSDWEEYCKRVPYRFIPGVW